MSQNSLFQLENDEKARIENLCAVCGQEPRIWDINIRDRCVSCNKKYFINEFYKVDLDEKGFKVWGENFVFYSHTTGREEVKKCNVLAVIYGLMSTEMFPFSVQICDDDKVFENTLGITQDFAEYLIAELKLKKIMDGTKEQIEFNGKEFHTKWVNTKIEQMERVNVSAEPPKQEKKLIKLSEAKEYHDNLYTSKSRKVNKSKAEKNQGKLI